MPSRHWGVLSSRRGCQKGDTDIPNACASLREYYISAHVE